MAIDRRIGVSNGVKAGVGKTILGDEIDDYVGRDPCYRFETGGASPDHSEVVRTSSVRPRHVEWSEK